VQEPKLLPLVGASQAISSVPLKSLMTVPRVAQNSVLGMQKQDKLAQVKVEASEELLYADCLHDSALQLN